MKLQSNMILEAGTLGTITATVTAFLLITLLLVGLLLFVKQKLSPSGPVKIKINGEKEIEVASGGSYFQHWVMKKYFYHLHVVVGVLVFSVSVTF